MQAKLNFKGLSNQEVLEKQKIYGLNKILNKSRPFWIDQLFKILANPVVIILLVTSLVLAFLGEYSSTIIVTLMVFLSIGLNFSQEYKSSKAVAKMAEKLVRKCIVIREGVRQEILVDQVVPEDIVFLSTGDIVPADGVVFELDNLCLNESALSGESFPSPKNPLTEQSQISQKKEFLPEEMVWTGTNVFGGWGYFQVIATGNNTKFAQIDKSLHAPEEKTTFEKEIQDFGMLILRVTLAMVTLIFGIILVKSFLENKSFNLEVFLTAFLFSVSIVVGLTPEMLPVILSLNMVRGSQAISQKGALVKRLNSIPDFGSMDVLCTDKTGTLTEDEIKLVKFLDIDGSASPKVLDFASLNSFFQSGLKNPLDEAILVVNSQISQNWQKIDEIPYDFDRKRLSVVVTNQDNSTNLQTFSAQRILISKGQVEEMLKISSFHEATNQKILVLNQEAKQKFQKIYEDLSGQGFRVLAVGYKKLLENEISDTSSEKNLILLGLLAFLDPPKNSAKIALQKIADAGIELKVITGDNEIVTQEICKQLEIKISGVTNGQEIDALENLELQKIVQSYNIFARCNPSQKLKIIQALKQTGHTVGYLGDGINDAPSLKASDVGISVNNAVDIARESADIILLKKDLGILVDGVFEGRKTFANTEHYMTMDLSSNFGNMFSMLIASVFLPFLPMLPIQILLGNFLYDISQTTLPLDNVDKEYLEKPRKWSLDFVQKFMLVFGSLSSVFDMITFYIMFKILNLDERSFQATWFLESLATQTLVIYVTRTRLIPFLQSRPNKWLVFSTTTVLLLAILLVFSPITNSFFGFEIPNNQALRAIFFLVVSYLVLAEITKRFFYNYIYIKST